MLKYTETEVTFAEIPDEITLCINISNCPCHCEGCHSPHLWQDIGEELDVKVLYEIIKPGVTCVVFMGGDSSPKDINHLALLVKHMFTHIKVAWYSGREKLPEDIDTSRFDYIKLGPYIKELGPINVKTTNQRLYKVVDKELIDITNKFWND